MPPSGGTAFIGGYSIIDQMEEVYKILGVCPQFNILWPDMTVSEHLLLYARLKGVSR